MGTKASQTLRQGGRYKPQIRVETIDGTQMLVKDYRPCGTWFRLLFGRWLVTREFEAYCAARGVPGVATDVRRLGPYVLAVDYADADPCTEMNGRPLPEDFWHQLTATVQALHARRIAHGDLKTLENTLVTHEGRVRVVDFSSAAYSHVDPIHLVGYPFLRGDDGRAIVKAKLLLAPERVTEREQVAWERRSLIERAFRWLRTWVRPWVKALGGRLARGQALPRPNKTRLHLDNEASRALRARQARRRAAAPEGEP